VGWLGWRSWWGAKRMDEAGIEAKRKSKAADKRKRKNAGIEAKAEKQIEESEAANRGHQRRDSGLVRQV